jgi:uncharacterized protein (TIGR03083 family)
MSTSTSGCCSQVCGGVVSAVVTGTVPIDNAAVRSALRGAAERLATMLHAVEAPDTPIPDSEWTIRQAAAHVAAGLGDYGPALSGLVPLRDLDPEVGRIDAQTRAVNAIGMQRFEDAGLDELATTIEDQVSALLASTKGMPGDEPFDWFATRQTTRTAMTGVLLGELVVHGYDMARAAGVPWPIDRDEAVMILLGSLMLMPAYVDPVAAKGVTSSYEIALRGGRKPSVRIGIRLVDGVAEVDCPARPPFDCRMNCEPVAMLLVSYGRISPWMPAAKGQIVAWGRKPWLGLQFPKLLVAP